MSIVHEIAVVGVETGVEPVVRNADVESACGVGECQVELLRVVRIGQSHAAPSRQRQAFIADAEGGLQGHIAQVLATPDITTDDISTDRCLNLTLTFNLILCDGGHTHNQSHSQ